MYAGAMWHHCSGLEDACSTCWVEEVELVGNIVVEDPRPTLQHFMIAMEGVKPWSNPETRKRGPGAVSSILFQNITIAAPSVLGEPDVLWGMADGVISDLIFDNVSIGGEPVEGIEHFHHNEFVL